MHIVSSDCASHQTIERLKISAQKSLRAAVRDSTVLCWKMVESIPSYFTVPHRCCALSQRVLRGAFFLSLLTAIPISLSRSTSLGHSHQVWERVGVFSPCLAGRRPS